MAGKKRPGRRLWEADYPWEFERSAHGALGEAISALLLVAVCSAWHLSSEVKITRGEATKMGANHWNADGFCSDNKFNPLVPRAEIC